MNSSDQELARQLAKVTPATATHLLEQKGISNTYMAGLQAVTPVAGTIVGRARTLRQIPMREDVYKAMVAAGRNPQRLVADNISEGDLLVIDSGGEVTAGSIGDIISARIKAQGGVGVISDGGLRDGVQIRELVGLPCFVKGIHGAASQRSFMAIDHDQPIGAAAPASFPATGSWPTPTARSSSRRRWQPRSRPRAARSSTRRLSSADGCSSTAIRWRKPTRPTSRPWPNTSSGSAITRCRFAPGRGPAGYYR